MPGPESRMGRRQKPRFRMVLPVSIWGTDTDGNAFHQLAYTLDISTGGARLAGVMASLASGEIVTVRYRQSKARFRVAWVGNNQVGIQYVEGEKFIWIELPEGEFVDETPAGSAQARLAETPVPSVIPDVLQFDVESTRQELEGSQELQTSQKRQPTTDAEPFAAVTDSATTGSTDELAATLGNCLATLHSLDGLVASAGMMPEVVREFRASAAHLRNTAWAVEQWIEAQQESGHATAILETLNSERVRFAVQLCREVAEGRAHLAVGVSQENREALANAVRILAEALGVDGVGGAPEHSGGTAAVELDPVTLLAGLNNEIRSATLAPCQMLELIAERARSFTGAHGAAIALREEDEMVCRANAGMAPLVGVRFALSGGLVGDAIATRQPVVCHDVETDEKVDAAVCRSVHLRSSAIIPIVAGESVIGVLQVFSARPNAFHEASVSLLSQVGELVAALEPTLRLQPDLH